MALYVNGPKWVSPRGWAPFHLCFRTCRLGRASDRNPGIPYISLVPDSFSLRIVGWALNTPAFTHNWCWMR